MEPSDELAARLAANRFRLERDDFAAALERLLGRAAPEPVADPAHAAALAADFRAAYDDASPHEWALVTRAWGAADEQALADTLHRLSRNLGARPAWLLVTPPPMKQAAALGSDVALDNPLGFAAATGGALALLDGELPAGLRLVRHSHHGGRGEVRYTWELEVFGEPWLSAATRALRGIV
jgi:hypothetical protein